MEIEARAWTAQLSKAESEILQASQRLEKVFKEANMQSGDQPIPNPVKLVRRLTALEIALSNLKNDCEMISKKRTEMAKSVMEKQLDNASLIEELFQLTAGKAKNPFCQTADESQEEDESWRDLVQRLSQQLDLLSDAVQG